MAEMDLINAFDDCIDRLAAGESVEDCLRAYPQHAARLRPMLETGRLVRRANPARREVVLAQARVWARLEGVIAEAGPPPAPRLRLSRLVLTRPVLLAASLVLVFGVVLGLAALPGIIATVKPGEMPSPTMITLTPVPTYTPTVLPSESATPSPTMEPSSTPEPSPTLTPSATPEPSATITPSNTITPSRTPRPSATPSATVSETAVTPTPCTPTLPEGWVAYRVQPSDTLSALAANTGTTVERLLEVNCLVNANLIVVGQTLYLPRPPLTNTPTMPETSTPTVSDDGAPSAPPSPAPPPDNLSAPPSSPDEDSADTTSDTPSDNDTSDDALPSAPSNDNNDNEDDEEHDEEHDNENDNH